ncbi:glycosyltransferase family 2 protein [Halobacteriovorax sp.]|uniref:glycosyltransferase family 2 protein n=1 Tax=Halobacteriovorax sp. TaxID=2020862 RepID=UPI003AF1F553
MDLVTVIITTCKRNETLIRAVNSVLEQTYESIEVLIIDDSRDEVARKVICDNYGDNSRVIYLSYPGNKGLSYARNYGMEHSKGPFIAFLDDDDEWCVDKISKQIEYISDYDLVYCGAKIVKNDNSKDSYIMPLNQGKLRESIQNKGIATISSSILIKKKLYDEGIKFDEELVSSVDHDYWMQLAKSNKKIHGLNSAHVKIYDPAVRNTMMSSIENRQKGIMQFKNKWHDTYTEWYGKNAADKFFDKYLSKVMSKLSISMIIRLEFKKAFLVFKEMYHEVKDFKEVILFFPKELIKAIAKHYLPSSLKNIINLMRSRTN